MKKKVIIIGGGFGGLAAAKGLGNSDFEVLLVDKTNHHLFQPLLYQVASAALSPGDIAVPIREVVAHLKNVTVLLGEVTDINSKENFIQLKGGETHSFDHLIIATGTRHSYFGNDEWSQYALGMKTLKDALDIRNDLLMVFENAEQSGEDEDINLVVVGGGPTGVEMAGALAEIAKETLVNDFRKIDSSKAKIFLIEASSGVLGGYPQKLKNKAKKYLEDLGVTVLVDTMVTNITDSHVEMGEDKIKTKNIIWAAGNKTLPIMQKIGCELDKSGRAIVSKKLNVSNSENIYVIGDAAHFKTDKGSELPGVAPVAAQQGKYLAKLLLGKTKKDFSYWDKGMMATIGRFKAVMTTDYLSLGGFIAWLAWCFVHILFLVDFRNRIIVFTQWGLNFFFYKKGVRIINE